MYHSELENILDNCSKKDHEEVRQHYLDQYDTDPELINQLEHILDIINDNVIESYKREGSVVDLKTFSKRYEQMRESCTKIISSIILSRTPLPEEKARDNLIRMFPICSSIGWRLHSNKLYNSEVREIVEALANGEISELLAYYKLSLVDAD